VDAFTNELTTAIGQPKVPVCSLLLSPVIYLQFLSNSLISPFHFPSLPPLGRCDVLINNAAICFNDPTLYGKVPHTPFQRQAEVRIQREHACTRTHTYRHTHTHTETYTHTYTHTHTHTGHHPHELPRHLASHAEPAAFATAIPFPAGGKFKIKLQNAQNSFLKI
jgi:hypothetical protein